MAAPTHDFIPPDRFSDRLIRVRRHLGLTQEEAALRCGLNSKTWATWETGTSPQKMNEVVNAISRGLGVNSAWLMWGVSPESAWITHSEADQLAFWPVLVPS